MTKPALLFSGQGSQYVGMCKTLCENYPEAGLAFEEANDILGFDLQKLCFEGSQESLTMTENAQPAILTASYAFYKVFSNEFGVESSYFAGHSLGEISALTCAGAIEFHDAVRIVRKRGLLMQEAAAQGVGSMCAVSGMSKDYIEEECRNISSVYETVVVSNYNSPDQTVISGHKAAVEKLCESLTLKGARITPLKVSAPFHSPLMEPVSVKMVDELKKYVYFQPRYPVISSVNALPYASKDVIVENLSNQIRMPVRWQEAMEYLKEQGVGIVIEMGPQSVLKNLMKRNAPGMKAFSYDNEKDVQALREEFPKGLKQQEKGKVYVHTVVSKCIAIAVCTKNRNWDSEEYRKGVVEPYRRIQKIQEKIEKENRQPEYEEMKDAVEMLKSVFHTKKVPIEEQEQRFKEVHDVTGSEVIFGI